jgi:hypothetical protein
MRLSDIILRSLFIWFCTCTLASSFHWIYGTTGHGLEKILLLSLVCSLPAFLLLIPIFYLLNSIMGRGYRITSAFVAILMLCLIVVVLFVKLINRFPIDNNTIRLVVAPYFFTAQLSFFIAARKLILVRN